jgi:hypothetical protein
MNSSNNHGTPIAATPNYWLVGAMWGSGNDQYDLFIRRNYWKVGYDDEDQPLFAQKRDLMKNGDRIAIKKMLGQGAGEIQIRAIGVIKEIDPDDGTIYINWLLADLNRKAYAKGCFKTIHGPYQAQDPWIQQIFMI